jgi:hypothetical protein
VVKKQINVNVKKKSTINNCLCKDIQIIVIDKAKQSTGDEDIFEIYLKNIDRKNERLVARFYGNEFQEEIDKSGNLFMNYSIASEFKKFKPNIDWEINAETSVLDNKTGTYSFILDTTETIKGFIPGSKAIYKCCNFN